MVREFQRVISTEARSADARALRRAAGRVAACVGGGSNAMGMFADFIDDPRSALRLRGRGRRHRHRTPRGLHHRRAVGVLHGMRTYVLQDEDGQTIESHSISAGLDYPGVGPEHAWLAATGRAHYEPVTDAEAMEAFELSPRPRASCPPSSPRTASPVRCGWAAASPRSSPTWSR
jgi:tryptophan synthase beta chain